MAIITIDEVLEHAEKFEQMPADYYAGLAEHTDPDVRDVFESLVRSEQRDEIELKKIEAMDYF